MTDGKEEVLTLDYEGANDRLKGMVAMFSDPGKDASFLNEFLFGSDGMILWGSPLLMSEPSGFFNDRIKTIRKGLEQNPEMNFTFLEDQNLDGKQKALIAVWLFLNGMHNDGDFFYDTMKPIEIVRIIHWMYFFQIHPRNPIFDRYFNKLKGVLSDVTDRTEVSAIANTLPPELKRFRDILLQAVQSAPQASQPASQSASQSAAQPAPQPAAQPAQLAPQSAAQPVDLQRQVSSQEPLDAKQLSLTPQVGDSKVTSVVNTINLTSKFPQDTVLAPVPPNGGKRKPPTAPPPPVPNSSQLTVQNSSDIV